MPNSSQPLYRDSSAEIDARVDDLLAHMTLEEKIAQLGSLWVYEILDGQALNREKLAARMEHGLGQITRLAGASSLDPIGCAKLGNTIQRFLTEETRLGIPALIHEECCSGYTARNATAFPQIIGQASMWEPEMVQAITSEIRRQMRAVGAHQGLSPILDIGRDPRWGRIEETFGEDPYLIARLGVAYIQGLQGKGLDEGVLATIKHFVGYSVTEGGLNWAPAHIGERELHEIYLHPFEAAVKVAKARSLMSGYHELDGIPVSASKWLLTDLLRDQWGFEGLVVSDYMSINSLYNYHSYAQDKAAASLMSIDAGVDVELPTTDCYGAPMHAAVEQGELDVALIDRAVRRHLRMKFALGLFENPYVAADRVLEVFDTPAQRELAYRAAQKSMVLLKNDDNLLPLAKELDSLAVIGPNADNVRNLLGDYSYPAHIELLIAMQGRGLSDTPLPENMDLEATFVEIQPVLSAIRKKVGAKTAIHYAQGCDVLSDDRSGFAAAVEAARRSDVAVVVVGDKAGLALDCSTGEFRDRTTLDLPGVQEGLVKAVIETGTPTVVVFANGRPVSSPWIAEHAGAILEAWFPGEEGAAAVADVLFGDYNPGGKLPLTIVRNAGQVPLFYNHKPSGARSFPYGPYVDCSNEPLFPFGFGLSYTTFALADLVIHSQTLEAGDSVNVSVTVANTGDRAGDEVVQLYTRHEHASVTRPIKELKGFKRVSLAPGEARRVTFTLYANQLAYFDRSMAYVIEPGIVEIMVGNSSTATLLTGSVEIPTRSDDLRAQKVFFSDVEIQPIG